VSGRIEQSGRLRNEPTPDNAIVVVRGGRDSVEKLAKHVARAAALWDYNGQPLHGISVFCGLDDEGPDSLNGVLFAMRTYRQVHLISVGEIDRAGYELLATGQRPHFTLHDPHKPSTLELQALLDVLGEPQRNPFFTTGRTS